MSNLSAYNKTVAAIIGAAATWATATYADTKYAQWIALAIAVLTAAGVYRVPNDTGPARDANGRFKPKDAGHIDATVVVVMLVIAVATVAIMGAFDLIPHGT